MNLIQPQKLAHEKGVVQVFIKTILTIILKQCGNCAETRTILHEKMVKRSQHGGAQTQYIVMDAWMWELKYQCSFHYLTQSILSSVFVWVEIMKLHPSIPQSAALIYPFLLFHHSLLFQLSIPSFPPLLFIFPIPPIFVFLFLWSYHFNHQCSPFLSSYFVSTKGMVIQVKNIVICV